LRFAITNKGYYFDDCRSNNRSISIISHTFSNKIKRFGRSNWLMVEIEHEKLITLSVNGKVLAEIKDDLLLPGSVGITAGIGQSKGKVIYQDFQIHSL